MVNRNARQASTGPKFIVTTYIVRFPSSMGHGTIAMTAAYTVPLEEEMKKMCSSFQMWEQKEKIIMFPVEKQG